ncbi:MAG TPA: hypothetical protein VL614_12375 [Acetobacteraceae bacterium]|jgi:hypothetical protein|nr:hypothetical protein [Acetobacteraceae bacterium]
MRRLILALLLFASSPAYAADLALKRVMLSSAGVGYFEYEADVDGAATLGLDVPLDQVDDVLTSLIVFDSAGGVGTVELPGRDNTRAEFGNLPFGPSALNSPVDYLNSLQGVEISVRGPRPMTGRIMHADRITETMSGPPPATVQRTRVTLMGTSGLQQFVLEDAESIEVTDTTLRARIGSALESLRREASLSMRHITLHSDGTGHRTVRVGYVAVAPLWKASYRLVLPPKDGDPARLQGWAVLENQSGTDWNGIALTLQYGNPVTFRQAIYRSYYVQRPEVPVEILGRILPDVDTRARAAELAKSAPAGKPGFAAEAPALAAPAPAPMVAQNRAMAMAQPSEQVQAAEGLEETIFQLASPVVLAAGHTANVPIIDKSIPAERVDLATGNDTHPLSAIRINNNTGTSLPAGVLTLYDASGPATFAGDARLGGLPAGESRLLSFAQDLRTTVERESSGQTSLASLTAAQGVLHVTMRHREILHVTLTAPTNESRRVLVEILKDGDRTLTLEGGAVPGTEETATAWRVPVSLKPGEVHKLTAYLDRIDNETTDLMDNDAAVVVSLLGQQTLTSAARSALQHLALLRQDLAAKRTALEQLKVQQAEIEQDEDRIRKNLQAVAANDALHARLTRALDADETKLEQLAAAIKQAASAADKAHQMLADAVATLKI